MLTSFSFWAFLALQAEQYHMAICAMFMHNLISLVWLEEM